MIRLNRHPKLVEKKRSALSSARIVERNSPVMEVKYGNSVRITATLKKALEQAISNSDILFLTI